MSKNKIISIIAGAVIASSLLMGAALTNTHHTKNITLLASATTNSETKAVVINNANSHLALYDTSSSDAKISSYISVGEMLTINKTVGNYYYVTVQETGAKGYINKNNAQIIKSGINSKITPIDKSGFIINVSSFVYLRSQPTLDASTIGSLLNSTNIAVISKQGDWYKVKTNAGVGYVYSEYVGISNESILSGNTTDKLVAAPINTNGANVKTNKTATYTTNNSDVVIKSAPDWNSKSLGTIDHKSIPIKVLSSSNNWDKVEFSNGATGYVPHTSIINQIVNTATTLASTTQNAVQTANTVANNISSIITSASNVVNTVNNTASDLSTHAANNIKDVNSNIKSNITSTANNAKKTGDNVAQTVKSINNTVHNVSNSTNAISKNVADTTQNVGNAVQSTFENTNKNIKEINDNITSRTKEASDTINTIQNNIKTSLDNVNQKIKNINNAINQHIG